MNNSLNTLFDIARLRMIAGRVFDASANSVILGVFSNVTFPVCCLLSPNNI